MRHEVDLPTKALKAALDRVDKRMLTESPALVTYKLKFTGGNLVPDIDAYKKEAE